MANRRPQSGNHWRSDFSRNNRGNNFNRSNVSPWQDGGIGPANNLPSLLPLAAGSTEATLALASNIINLLQPRQNTVPSLLDMPMQRDFGPNLNRYNRGFNTNKMSNQGNFRRTGTYPRSGDRIGNRRPNRPYDGPRHQRKSSPKKDSDPKTKPVRESTGDKKESESTDKTENEATEEKKNRFDDIDPKMLFCHICNKSMWDGRSFENHINGRAHAIMMQKTAESYALTADTIRQELKIREMKRTRKSGVHMPREFYCAMCDLYAADGAEHRTTMGHRKLKKYLHPACLTCHKEMPTRIELDEHKLTPEHMRKQGPTAPEQPEVMQIYTLSMETSYVRGNERRSFADRNKKEAEEKKEDGDQEDKKDDTEDVAEENDEKKLDESEEQIDSEDTIVDFKEGDDLSNITTDMLPKYSPKRGVGRSFLSEFRCVQCKLCNKLLDSDETAEVHLKTWRHHRLFTRMLRKNIEPEQPAEKEKETESEPTKRPSPTEDSGNWKRRKITTSEMDDQNGHDDDDIKDESTNDGGNEENPSAEGDGEANCDEPMIEDIKQDPEPVQIKKEKDDDIEIVQVKQETQEQQVVEEKKGKPAARGRGRGRRSTRI